MEGRRRDAALLAESGLLGKIEFHTGQGRPLCIYGDCAYPLNQYLLCPYKGARITPEQDAFNRGMSCVREAIEWTFGKIVSIFAFVDFKKNQKLYLQPIGKYFLVASILTNCHTCFYGGQVASYFGMTPLTIEEYLHQ